MDTTEHATIKLLVRSRIHEDENLISYRTRVAYENGLESPRKIFGRAGTSYEACLQTVNRVSSITGQHYDQLLSRAYIDIMRYVPHVPWYHQMISKDLLRKNPVICPACFAEKGYVRSSWDLKMVVACPYHECWLVDKCPSCENSIEWNRIKLNRCKCGHCLSNFNFITCSELFSFEVAEKIESFLGFDSGSSLEKRRSYSYSFENISVPNLMKLYRGFLTNHYTLPGASSPSYANAYSREFRCEMFSFNHFSSVVEKWPDFLKDREIVMNEKHDVSGLMSC